MIVMSFPDRRTHMGTLVLDVLLSEEIDMPSQVSQYPVEDGTIISDHITQGSETLRISGLMSIAGVAAFSNLSPLIGAAKGGAKMIDIVESLRSMHRNRALVVVSSGQSYFRDFAFTSLSMHRSADDGGGNWLSIKAELIKVRKVRLKTAEVPAKVAAAPASGRAGATGQPAGRSTPSSTSSSTSSVPAPANVSPLFGGLRGLGIVRP